MYVFKPFNLAVCLRFRFKLVIKEKMVFNLMHSLQVKKLSKVLRSPLKPLPEPDLNPSLCPSAAALLLPLSFHRRLQSSGSH